MQAVIDQLVVLAIMLSLSCVVVLAGLNRWFSIGLFVFSVAWMSFATIKRRRMR